MYVTCYLFFCHGNGCDRASFVCRSSHNAVFWNFDDNSGDTTLMLLVVAEPCLHGAEDFFLFLMLPCQWGGRGCTIHSERTRPGQLTQTDQRDSQCHMMSCSAIKAVMKEEEAEDIHSNGICLPNRLFSMLSTAFLEVAKHLLALGSSEWIPCLALLVHVTLLSLVNCPYLNS